MRILLGVIGLALCAQDGKPPTYALLGSLASYLSDGNATGALSAFSKNIDRYGSLQANINALTAQFDILCSIEVLEESGDDQHRTADAEWYFELHSKEESGPTERRQKTVKISFAKEGKSWKITGIEPRSILEVPR